MPCRFEQELSLWQITRRYGFHFISLISIIVFMLWGYSPTLSVFWSTVLTFGLSFLTRETAIAPKKLVRALSDGSTSVLTAATTCATAGIIVGVVTLTGLGLKFSSIVIGYAGGSLLLTAIYTALIVWIVGLAVPVTASYIICAVIAAPAMIKLGVPDCRRPHVHLLLFGAVGGVAADRAVAVRGRRDHRRRSLQDHAAGLEIHAAGLPGAVRVRARSAGHRACCSRFPKDGSWVDIVLITGKTALGLAALAAAAQGWALRKTTTAERLLLVLAGLFLVFPSLLEALIEAIIGRDISYTATFGLAIAAAVLLKQRMQPAPPRAQATGRQ